MKNCSTCKRAIEGDIIPCLPESYSTCIQPSADGKGTVYTLYVGGAIAPELSQLACAAGN